MALQNRSRRNGTVRTVDISGHGDGAIASPRGLGSAFAIAAVAMGFVPAPVTAQATASGNTAAAPASAAQADAAPGDIIVTAQRREESLQRVPIALSAVTPAVAERLNIRNVQDLQIVTPGLNYKAPYTYAQIYIRGVGTQFANPGLETSVAVYADGVYLERQLGTVFDLVDPATTQVLKGPQGTLYGRNATGGVILLNTAEPTNKSEGRVAIEYGKFNRIQGDVMLNQPITDTLRLRIAVRGKKDDGYITNDFNGRTLGGAETYVARAKLAWTPTPGVDLLWLGEYVHDKADGAALALRSTAPLCLVCAIIPGNGPVIGKYHTNQDVDSPAITKSYFTSLRARIRAGDYDIQGTIGFRRFTWRGLNDVDLTSVNFFTFNSFIGGSTYTGDFQVASHYSGPFNLLAGVSLLEDKGFFSGGLSGLAFGGLPELRNLTKVRTKSAAGFAEGYYEFTPNLKLTLGGRYSAEKKSIDATNFDPAPLVFGSAGFKDDASFKSFTPRAVLAYTAPIGNFYASYTKGFKSGGYNDPAFTPAGAVDPEKIESYEIGAKLKFLEGRLTINLAGFHYNYRNLQVNVTDLARGGTFLENAGSARGNGAEFDIQVSPMQGLTLSGGGAYLDAKFKRYTNAQVYNSVPPGIGFQAISVDLSGTRLPRAPKFSGYASLSYDADFGGDWKGNVSLVASYSSSFDLTAGAGGPFGYNVQKAYTIVNLTGYVSPPGGHLRLGYYVENLGDRRYIVNSDTTQYGLYRTYARPRSYGVRGSYSF